MKKLIDFIGSERDRFENNHNNMFAFSFSEITRYSGFLEKIFERYKVASKNFMENTRVSQAMFSQGSGKVTTEGMTLLNQSREMTTVLHLEIESFYQFAKISLDKIAHSIEFYFGPVRKLSFDSHDDLTKGFGEYITKKGLIASKELLEIIPKLKKDISDYRDYKIVHEISPRVMKGTIFQGDGKTRISLTKLYPTEKDQKELQEDIETKFLDDLKVDIDTYLSLVIDFIKENSHKTNLKVQKTT